MINLLQAVEKYVGGEANYAKGKGAVFEHWMRRYHPTAYLFVVSRACGGSRQDIGVEGAVAVLMNTPYYLEFLIWRMRCGHTDGILERNLFMLLRSVEMISFCACSQFSIFLFACRCDGWLEIAAVSPSINLVWPTWLPLLI